MSDSLRPHELQHTRLLSFTIFQSFLKFMSIKSVMPSNHLILCHPILLLPSSFPASGSGLIWFDLPALQGTLKGLLQHHSLKPSVLWCSAFFMVQLLHSHVTTGKTIALTIHLCFLIHCLHLYSSSSKEQVSFNFMATVTIHSDFGAQENKI